MISGRGGQRHSRRRRCRRDAGRRDSLWQRGRPRALLAAPLPRSPWRLAAWLMVAVAGLIAAVVVPVSLTNGTDKALTRSVGPTSPREQTVSESVEMSEESASARPAPSSLR